MKRIVVLCVAMVLAGISTLGQGKILLEGDVIGGGPSHIADVKSFFLVHIIPDKGWEFVKNSGVIVSGPVKGTVADNERLIPTGASQRYRDVVVSCLFVKEETSGESVDVKSSPDDGKGTVSMVDVREIKIVKFRVVKFGGKITSTLELRISGSHAPVMFNKKATILAFIHTLGGKTYKSSPKKRGKSPWIVKLRIGPHLGEFVKATIKIKASYLASKIEK